MLLRQPNFFDEEKQAPILDRNNDYLHDGIVEKVIHRTAQWPALVSKGSGKGGFVVKDIPPTASDRIIHHDAERTFTSDSRRKILTRVLSCYENAFSDYHQGLSLTCGFLLLSLPEQDVATIVSHLATNPKYIPDYWRAEAIAGARDAYVWEFLLHKHYPEVATHLQKRGVLPETFCQKWFIALTINVLPFNALYSFFENFLELGHLYLFQFGLTFVSAFKEHILKSPDYEIFKILRYDKELHKKYDITDDMVLDVVQRAASFQLVPFDLDAVRLKVFEEKLKARLERAKQLADEKDDDLSDETDESDENDDDDDDEDEEGGVECALCKENAPDMWCTTCKVVLCEMCHSGNKKGHKKNHKVNENWEKFVKT